MSVTVSFLDGVVLEINEDILFDAKFRLREHEGYKKYLKKLNDRDAKLYGSGDGTGSSEKVYNDYEDAMYTVLDVKAAVQAMRGIPMRYLAL